jgi:hypothetical protein
MSISLIKHHLHVMMHYSANRHHASVDQHYLGMKQAAGDAAGHTDQVGLTGKDLDPWGAREFGQVYVPAEADVAEGCLVGGYGWNGRQELARMNEQVSCPRLCRGLRDVFQSVSVLEPELGHGSAPQGGKVGSAAEFLA